MMASDTCAGCGVATDSGLCGDCFAALPMDQWVTVDQSAPVLCGACSDDLGDPGEWADAVRELDPADRIPCQGCGA